MVEPKVEVWTPHYHRKVRKLCRELGVRYSPTITDGRRAVVLLLDDLESVHASTDWA